MKPGTISWIDLTIDDATGIRDFYREVVGWETSDVDMGGYDDFCVHPTDGDAVAGICHARGANAAMPARWLIYITVADLDESVAKCLELGGKLAVEPRTMGGQGRYCVIEDPAGAVAALFQPIG